MSRSSARSASSPRIVSRRVFLGSCASPLLTATALSEEAGQTAGYNHDEFDHAGLRLQLWTKGSGPLVFVLHEMNGLTRNCFVLGDDLVSRGFSVTIPRFFGDAGGAFLGYFKACFIGSAFNCHGAFDAGSMTPWIKALALHRSGNANFGAVGNCMTGMLPLLMLRSVRCIAPVLCHPAYPLRRALIDPGVSSLLGLSQIDVEFARLRSRRDGVPILAIRYERDTLCPSQRFVALRERFEDNFHCVQLVGKGHSTLITHRCALAFEHVVAFLRHRLMGAVWQPPPADCLPTTCGNQSGHGGRG